MAFGCAVVIGWVSLGVRAWPHLPFLAMLAIALPASRHTRKDEKTKNLASCT